MGYRDLVPKAHSYIVYNERLMTKESHLCQLSPSLYKFRKGMRFRMFAIQLIR